MSVINCKCCYIRPKYNNLEEWCKDPNNIYIWRKGIGFINKIRYPTSSSIFSNPFKITKYTTRENVLDKYKVYIIDRLKNDENLKKRSFKIKR